MTKNPFLPELIRLQQDGAAAISAPSNWMMAPPLLEVQTQLDATVEELVSRALSRGGENSTAEWHFFVGSPGNGKSAATGQLARKLTDIGCQILTEDKDDIATLEPGDIPYLLHVVEPQNSHVTLWIAQDASVVRDPYSPSADPAIEFVNLLEAAYDRRVSLVVCTNRGVIEKAFRRVYQDPEITRLPWFKAMKLAVENGQPQSFKFPAARRGDRGFTEFRSSTTKLDRRSLLIGSDTFERLIAKATSFENWSACSNCESKQHCPFFQNRVWLLDNAGQASLTELLRKSEVLSGQIIVFREALALLSFILAGCPRDYEERHPCEWVHSQREGMNIFALASRRIYMNLYSAYALYGLEVEEENRNRQCLAMRDLCARSERASEPAFVALKKVAELDSAPTPDVGAHRLLARHGVLSQLDPLNDPLRDDFLNKWDGPLEGYSSAGEFASAIEKDCLAFWDTYSEELQNSAEAGTETHRWLRRWITAFSFRFGGLYESRTAYHQEINELVELAGLAGERLTPRAAARLAEVQTQLRAMLGEQSSGVQISDFVTLVGDWPLSALAPRVELGEASDRLALVLRFPGKVDAYVEAEVYVWLRRLNRYRMSRASFPMEYLEAARDALVRAAVRSNYSTTPDVTLQIGLPKKRGDPSEQRFITIQRVDGIAFIPEDR